MFRLWSGWTKPAMTVSAAGPVSAFPRFFAAAAVVRLTPAPVAVLVAPAPVVAFAEGILPTAESP